MKYGIHWFRRDLRVAGNVALHKQFLENKENVLGIFCFDKKFLSRTDFSVNRFQLFLNSLVALRNELRILGSDLLVLDVGPEEAFRLLFDALEKEGREKPSKFSWSRDYEPFAVKRDKKIAKFLKDQGIEFFSERDHLLIEPHELEKDGGGGYQVYSPFARKWIEIFQSQEIQKRLSQQNRGLSYLEKFSKNSLEKIFDLNWQKLLGASLLKDYLEAYVVTNKRKVTVKTPEAGSLAAYTALKKFKQKIDEYGGKRDFPYESATSQLSPYLKNGSITVPQIIAYLNLEIYHKKKSGRDIYFSELIWREFYYHILARHPRVESEAFLDKYKDINWKNNPEWFAAWKEGVTGFPIVDAGMRQLKETGWMHNRVRMIVASFLTKDLLIDWRWGEKYFMEQLLDGDLASNNGGWQWAASTGCDPQPYFRIFNPWLQGKKFDPEGKYIKKYLPELKNLDAKKLHEPIEGHESYPEPIVDHATQRNKALKLYSAKA